MRHDFRDIQVQRGIKTWNYSYATIAVVKIEVSCDIIYVTSCKGIYFCKLTIYRTNCDWVVLIFYAYCFPTTYCSNDYYIIREILRTLDQSCLC